MDRKICKECLKEKVLTDFYKHPQWVMWTLPRCKECIKKWRKSERERKMARINDLKRSKKPKRIKYQRERTIKYRQEHKNKYNAHKKVWNYLKNIKYKYNFECCICLTKNKIELHHEDYNKPNEIIPFCSLHHKWYHYWKNWIDLSKKIILPF